jgi:hypothetical protein
MRQTDGPTVSSALIDSSAAGQGCSLLGIEPNGELSELLPNREAR